MIFVAEDRQVAGATTGAVGCCLRLEARDPVEDQLADARVVANDDEYRRSPAGVPAGGVLFPFAIALLVMQVEASQCALEPPGICGGPLACRRPFLGSDRDALPDVSVGRPVAGHRVVGHGNAGNLDDAALDGVDQREIGHDPREERSLGIAGTAQVERRRRHVVGDFHADRFMNRFDSAEPEAGFLFPVLRFAAVVAGQFLIIGRRLRAVAMMGLVTEDDNLLLRAEFPANAANHFGRRFGECAGLLRGRMVFVNRPASPFSRSLKP